MRRLLIFCDGTWNKASTQTHTNVVTAAQAVLPIAADGTVQIVCYLEGVGTNWILNRRIETMLAGAFGLGLFARIAEAYRFLVFNYTPGDEICIFGFSRGAFTARSLAGLIRKCGIIPKDQVRDIASAYAFYRRPDIVPDDPRAQQFRAEKSPDTIMKDEDRVWRRNNGYLVPDLPNFTIRYIGVWDTVGALGVPKYILLGNLLNQRYQFHDLALSSIVAAARQALAIDETRVEFEPAPWNNLSALNEVGGREGSYEQLWFPGDHGSVGGGGDIAGLSNRTLAWIVEGGVLQGMAITPGALDAWNVDTDVLAPLHNSTKPPGFVDRYLYRHAPRRGPDSPYGTLGEFTRERLLYQAKSAGGPPLYRPDSLAPLLAEYPEVVGEP